MSLEIRLIEPPALKLVATTPEGESFALPTVRTHFPKMQLLTLSNALRESLTGVNVSIIDMKLEGQTEVPYKTFEFDGIHYECFRVGKAFESLDGLLEEADIVAISSPFTQAAQIVTDLAKYSKSINPHIKTVVGGYDTITAEREKYYRANGFNAVIPRDGETELPRWVATEFGLNITALQQSKIVLPHKKRILSAEALQFPLPDLENVDFRKYIEAEDGSLPEGSLYPISYLIGSKGCDRTCSFCTIPKGSSGRYSVIELEKLETLLDFYLQHGISTVLLSDSNPLTRLRYGEEGRRHLIETFKMLRNKGFAWEWFDGIEFGRLADERGGIDYKLIDLLFTPEFKDGRLVGGYRAYIPVEAGYEKYRKDFDKLRPYDVQFKIIESILGTGVKQLSYGQIVGYPYETKDTIEQTKVTSNKLKEITERCSAEALFIFYVHQLFPGAPDYIKYRDMLLVGINEYPELFQLYTATKPARQFSLSQVTLLRRYLDRQFNGLESAMYSEKTGRAPTLRPITGL